MHRSASFSCQFAQKCVLLIILQMCSERQKKPQIIPVADKNFKKV